MKLATIAIEKINETNSWFFKKINKMYKPLARLTKTKGDKTHFKNEAGNITTDPIDLTGVIRECCKQLHTKT